jgi:hypothetical protein
MAFASDLFTLTAGLATNLGHADTWREIPHFMHDLIFGAHPFTIPAADTPQHLPQQPLPVLLREYVLLP